MSKLDGLRQTIAYIKAHAAEPIILFPAAMCRELEADIAIEGDPLFKTGEAMEKKYPAQIADLDGVAIIEDTRALVRGYIPNCYTPEIEESIKDKENE